MTNYQQLIYTQIMDEQHFVSAIFNGQQHGQSLAWERVGLRPVSIKDKWHVQISYFDGRQDITKNYRGEELAQKLTELLAVPFSNFHVRTTDGDTQIRITKKGKPLIHRTTAKHQKPDLKHDRPKQVIFVDGEPNPFLQAVGIVTSEGRVKAKMQGKFRQINEFLRLIQETGELEKFSDLLVVDCGCGNAYLTFAAHYYLNQLIPTQMIGVDIREGLLQNHTKTAQHLGLENIEFVVSSIIDFQPARVPDMVLALHACDTATDEALAQAICWQSRLIFSVPCCHHHLQAQLNQQKVSPFEPVFRHGILRERMGDILTDTFRALILRIMGYQTQVIEFVSTEHTAKNLMIRAVLSTPAGDTQFVDEYLNLRNFWKVTPYLETLLGEHFTRYLG